MSHLRCLSYSISLASIVTALSVFFGEAGGSLLLIPGVLLEFILTTIFPHGDGEDFGYTENGWAGSFILYALGSYLLLWLYTLIRGYQQYLSEQARPPSTET